MTETRLSRQEIEVLWLTAWGFTGAQIGARLGISSKTVGTYKMRAARKLGLGSRVAVVRHALANKWFEIDPAEVASLDLALPIGTEP